MLAAAADHLTLGYLLPVVQVVVGVDQLVLAIQELLI
jgi:hypothetical protein